jgi:hypothetical protein
MLPSGSRASVRGAARDKKVAVEADLPVAGTNMTLRRKGTRSIVVEGLAYRWTVAPNDEPGLAIVVEHAEAPAQRLVSWFEHGTTISPRLVRAAILDGLRAGWHPTATGRDVIRREALLEAQGRALHACPCCDYITLPRRAEYEICPVCFWEDDGLDIDDLDTVSGPNHITLREARVNFGSFGACDDASRLHVLPEGKRRAYARRPR